MSDDVECIRFLNATSRLSDLDFERSLHDNGFRVVSWVQRKAALSGDKRTVDACEIYLKRAETCLKQHRGGTGKDDSSPSPEYKPRTPNVGE